LRLGAYIAHPTIITINLYFLINTYRWDWLTVLVIVVSILFIYIWTGIYTALSFSAVFFDAAEQIYSQPSFWAVCIVTPIVSIMPRYFVKAIQKVYYPYDVDIIREQVSLGLFKDVEPKEGGEPSKKAHISSSGSSELSQKKRYPPLDSVDEDLRPIYPPSVATYSNAGTYNAHSQNGSDGTNYTRHDQHSVELPRVEEPESEEPVVRPSFHRVRPSFDRMRASMDQVRPSFENTNEFTSAAMLSRFESTHSGVSGNEDEAGGFVERIRRRTRGKSIKAVRSPFALHHKDQSHAE
jgi:phospholipid-translocating ATPase